MTDLASYSFKNDPDVPPHDHNKDLIVFDHECIFCSSFIRFVFAHDRSGRFLFTAAQSPLGQALYRHYGLDPTDFSTNLVILDGNLHTKMDAFATAMRCLGFPWSLFAVVNMMPRRLANAAYDLIAKNRYRIFGRYEICLVPSKELRARVIE
ncbi:putative DCC family thiol-disulfide oxidoreductase YuxK [Rhizobium sp. BK313]|uniref:thiol-disulfide oxidoreductase DCC family protein n=1 Tax=Rhizobium sp. BK313 TaxID=2587081 RepID=UPI00105B5844|nr:DCC1-like thiol-disulfide oxidoreductase family protein [Rhizobium sp. BK313]MBB3455893.1 putative DCC family thiol-disulfide oxidoreductase YuxK [Rhizobium sp. BK313]